jgi:hypothetical protein
VEATGEDMVTVGAIGGVLHLSPEYPTIVGGGKTNPGAAKKAGGGVFLSEPASPPEGSMVIRDGAGINPGSSSSSTEAAAEKAGLRLIEDRTAAASLASSWGYRTRQVADALGQEALAALVLVLGGVIILMLMRWRRRGPWSPRMPR